MASDHNQSDEDDENLDINDERLDTDDIDQMMDIDESSFDNNSGSRQT